MRALPITYLADLRTGQVLHAHNADRRFVPASVTKVMTAYLGFEALAAGEVSADTRFIFTPSAAEKWERTGSTLFLDPGEQVSVDTLLRGITSVSANDGAVVLAEGLGGSVPGWVRKMNAAARTLGMHDTRFGTPNGWPDDGRTFTTARDLHRLARALFDRHPRMVARYFGQPGMRHNGFTQVNHDPISGVIEGADGLKTGYTREAGFTFLGTARRGDRRLVMVLAGADRASERNAAARDLIEWGFDRFERRRLFAAGDVVGRVRVQGARVGFIPVRTIDDVLVTIPRGAAPSVVSKIRYHGPVRAPIADGTPVATLSIEISGLPPVAHPLVADATTAPATLRQRVARAFDRLL